MGITSNLGGGSDIALHLRDDAVVLEEGKEGSGDFWVSWFGCGLLVNFKAGATSLSSADPCVDIPSSFRVTTRQRQEPPDRRDRTRQQHACLVLRVHCLDGVLAGLIVAITRDTGRSILRSVLARPIDVRAAVLGT